MTSVQKTNDQTQSNKSRPVKRTRSVTQPEASAATTETPQSLQLAASQPRGASSSSILVLQRKFGNRAVSRLIQAKLTVGAANDKYEQEADRVAQQVLANPAAGSVQRHHVESEEEGVQRKPLAAGVTPLIQRHALPLKKESKPEEEEEEEDGSVQRQAASPNVAGGFEAGAEVEQKLASQSGQGQSLPDPVRGDMEQHFGNDFSQVRVHTGGEAVQLNRDLSAQAFTHGHDIYFGAGRYNPAASEGKQLLAHELTHVVQQSGQIAPKRLQRTIRSPRQWWRDREAKKQESSFNIRMGQDLPNTRDMAEEMIGTRQKDEQENIKAEKDKNSAGLLLPTAKIKVDDEQFMAELLTEYNLTAKAPADESVLTSYQVILKGHLQTGTDLDEIITASKEDSKKIKDKFVMARLKFAYAFHEKVKAEAEQQSQGTPIAPAYHSSDQRYLQGDKSSMAKQFWSMRETYEMTDAYLNDTQRKAFSDALKLIPTMQALLNPKSVAKTFRQDTGWKDGGSLVDKIQVVKDIDKKVSPHRLLTASAKEKLNNKRANSKSFRDKVNVVDRMSRIMVESELLSLVPRPILHMHTAAGQGFTTPWGYRANASKGHVNVTYDESMDVIAHEVGHAIEAYLPMERWHDIHMLMGLRHQAAGGGKARAGATPLITTLSEGRYAGKYTTGKYTTTAYKDGNAEVISMAMQFLVNPSDALKLIEGDPQHAATVLRALRPNEYAATDALRPFDKFIPHKKAAPKLPPKPSPEKIKAMKLKRGLESHRNKPLPPIPVKDKDKDTV